jgi:hypothetical protein
MRNWLLAAALSLIGCSGGAGTRDVTGRLTTQAYPLDNPVIVAESSDHRVWIAHLSQSGAFKLTIPTGVSYRLTLANSTRSGTYQALARVNWPLSTGPARWAQLGAGDTLALGHVAPRAQTAAGGLGIQCGCGGGDDDDGDHHHHDGDVDGGADDDQGGDCHEDDNAKCHDDGEDDDDCDGKISDGDNCDKDDDADQHDKDCDDDESKKECGCSDGGSSNTPPAPSGGGNQCSVNSDCPSGSCMNNACVPIK